MWVPSSEIGTLFPFPFYGDAPSVEVLRPPDNDCESYCITMGLINLHFSKKKRLIQAFQARESDLYFRFSYLVGGTDIVADQKIPSPDELLIARMASRMHEDPRRIWLTNVKSR